MGRNSAHCRNHVEATESNSIHGSSISQALFLGATNEAPVTFFCFWIFASDQLTFKNQDIACATVVALVFSLRAGAYRGPPFSFCHRRISPHFGRGMSMEGRRWALFPRCAPLFLLVRLHLHAKHTASCFATFPSPRPSCRMFHFLPLFPLPLHLCRVCAVHMPIDPSSLACVLVK